MKKSGVIKGLVVAVIAATMLTGCPEQGSKAPTPAGTHAGRRPKPATVQPGGPEQGKPGIGNVRLTFWVTASEPVDVIYSIGGVVKPTHSCDRSCHWDDVGKPEQEVIVAVSHRDKSVEELLEVEVVQGNGISLCKDSNADRDPIDPVGCKNRIKI